MNKNCTVIDTAIFPQDTQIEQNNCSLQEQETKLTHTTTTTQQEESN